MLRPLLVVLLVGNALLLAANLGAFDRLAPKQRDREPERLARQIKPEALRVIPGGRPASGPAPAAAAVSAASAIAAASAPEPSASAVAPPPERLANAATPNPAAMDVAAAPATAAGRTCLQLGPLAPAALDRVTSEMRQTGWTEGQWQQQALPATSAYMVVMGPYADPDQLAKKQAELRRRKLEWEDLSASAELPAGVAPGLGLGRYNDEASAREALKRLGGRGVRTARVVALRPSARAELRVMVANAEQQARLTALALPRGVQWQACPNGGGGDQRR